MRWTRSNNNIRSSYEFLPVDFDVQEVREIDKTYDSWDYNYNGIIIFPSQKFSSL